MKKFVIAIGLFAALGLLLALAIVKMRDGSYSPRAIPSPLIDKPLPSFALPSLLDPTKTINNDTLRGRAYLLNVWASWCVACRAEHGLLVSAARDHRVPIVGLNYKDARDDALTWLKQLGDPYQLSIADTSGRYGIELGVYGVPETFLVDREGVVRYKHIGPVTRETMELVLLPKLAELNRTADSSR